MLLPSHSRSSLVARSLCFEFFATLFAAVVRAVIALKRLATKASHSQWRSFVSAVKPVFVLCVDDDPLALMARRMVLSTAGYDVLTASSGEDALRILRRRDVDLVIADAFLPRFSAAELTRAIKSYNPRIRVVLLTGAPELPSAVQADLILIKGRAPSDFLAEIAKVIAAVPPAEEPDPHGGGLA